MGLSVECLGFREAWVDSRSFLAALHLATPHRAAAGRHRVAMWRRERERESHAKEESTRPDMPQCSRGESAEFGSAKG